MGRKSFKYSVIYEENTVIDEIKKQPYSILFIEDEKAIREAYVNHLRRYFDDIYEAEDGEEGLKIYYDKKPDILIIDINLPKLSGIELLQIIREKDHTTKALMLTAHTETDLLIQASELKLTKYLIKPITRGALKEAIELTIEELSRFKIESKNILILQEGYTWNYKEKKLSKNSIEVILTALETKLFNYFLNNINISLSYDNIIENVWKLPEETNIDSLKTLVKKLRVKIPKNLIINMYSFGYKINQ